MTREEAMARFIAARNKKHECIERIEKRMKDEFEQRTGEKATYTFAL